MLQQNHVFQGGNDSPRHLQTFLPDSVDVLVKQGHDLIDMLLKGRGQEKGTYAKCGGAERGATFDVIGLHWRLVVGLHGVGSNGLPKKPHECFPEDVIRRMIPKHTRTHTHRDPKIHVILLRTFTSVQDHCRSRHYYRISHTVSTRPWIRIEEVRARVIIRE